MMRVLAALVLAPAAIAIAYAGGWLWAALVTLAAIGLYVEWLMVVGAAARSARDRARRSRPCGRRDLSRIGANRHRTHRAGGWSRRRGVALGRTPHLDRGGIFLCRSGAGRLGAGAAGFGKGLASR